MVIDAGKSDTVQEFLGREKNITLHKQFMVYGVEFIQVREDEDTVYYTVNDNGIVVNIPLGTHPQEFVSPTDDSITFSTLYETGEKVMVDDDGVHREW